MRLYLARELRARCTSSQPLTPSCQANLLICREAKRRTQARRQAHICTHTHIFGRGCPFGLSIHEIAHTEGSCVELLISDAEKTAKNEIEKKKNPWLCSDTHTNQMKICYVKAFANDQERVKSKRGCAFMWAWRWRPDLDRP